MKIAVIGNGNVGNALAMRFGNAGHAVAIGVRNPNDAELKKIEVFPNIRLATVQEAALGAEVIVVATPAHVAVELAAQLGSMEGKILVDATNAVRQRPEPYATAFDAFKALTQAECMKCFNTTGFENMQNPFYNNVAIDLFMAGSSLRGKQVVRELALSAGFGECYDFGGDDKVALQEQFAMAWINLAIMQGHGRNIAFKLLKR
ncbi:MAG TPA: NAD(P)-binding domain-containing protein [Bacteroidia bacterium]|nr:NAD(P)-binding domain-containing protein [Bacteroidia bacterium]